MLTISYYLYRNLYIHIYAFIQIHVDLKIPYMYLGAISMLGGTWSMLSGVGGI